MTLSTNGPTVTRSVAAAAIDRIVQHSTTGTVGSPRPMKWSQAQTPGVAGRVEAPGALEPPAGLGPDRAEADADRQRAGRRPGPPVTGPVSNSRMSSRDDRVAVAAGRAERRARAERVEVGREAPDEVEHDRLDPLGVLLEDLEHAHRVDRLGALDGRRRRSR